MSRLTIVSNTLAYDDEGATSNPTQRPINWNRTISNITVDNPQTEKFTVEPLGTKVLVDGSRATQIDGTTAFSLQPHPSDPIRYRLSATGGTAPGFRVDRAIAINGVALTLTVNSNLTLTITAGAGTPFSGVVAGDILFIPGASTGDAVSPFDPLNEGYWTVLSAAGAMITISRLSGEVFSGTSEAVTPTANSQFQIYSADGVQVGDTVELTAGFAVTARRAYEIVAVNPSWIEIQSTAPLGPEAGVLPGANGVLIYTHAKHFVEIEVDQECVVRLNGATEDSNRIEPWRPGDRNGVGQFRIVGTVWRLQIVNRGTVPVHVLMLSTE